MARRVRMSPVDTAWLRMDSPGNLMMIVGVDVFEGRLDVDRLRRLVAAHLLRHRPFRSRVSMDLSGAWWIEDERFDIERHVVVESLPGAADREQLQRFVGRLAGERLDSRRPLWQFHVVDNYVEGAALVVRIHHCIGDGIALVRVFLGMASASPEGDELPTPDPAGEHDAFSGPAPAADWLRPLTDGAVRALGVAGDVAARALRTYREVLEDSDRAGRMVAEAVRAAARVVVDAADLALMDPDTETSLKGTPSGAKCVAWNDPLSLSDVKVVGRALGCSVNDVLLACAAGAIRGYLADRGDAIDGAELRAMVPVNLRSESDLGLGNRFGLVPLLLPIGIAHPVERVLEVHRRMEALKGSTTAMLAMTILGVAGLAPRAAQRFALDMLARKATTVMTNVPGPREPLYMAGARLQRMMFWVPQSGSIGVGVSILSYAGGVQFGLITDRAVCDDPRRIIERFRPEFENLIHAVLLMPWDDEAARSAPQLVERSLQATEALAAAAAALARDHDAAGNAPAASEAVAAPAPESPAAHPVGHANGKDAFASADGAGEASAIGATAPAAGEAAPEAPAPRRLRRKRSAFAAARAAAGE